MPAWADDPDDDDGDGYGESSGDCDDADSDIHPDAAEICDEIDNDCDELIDDEDGDVDSESRSTWYADEDGDAFGDPDESSSTCIQPASTTDNPHPRDGHQRPGN